MNKLGEKQFVEEIRVRLDRSIENLPAAIEQRLDSARRLSLSETDNEAAASKLVSDAYQTLDALGKNPPEVEARLDQIRHNALAKLKSRQQDRNASPITTPRGLLQSFFQFRPGVPASMLATACVMVTVASIFYMASGSRGTFTLEEEISLIASADELELYENLDFYLWLEENGMPE